MQSGLNATNIARWTLVVFAGLTPFFVIPLAWIAVLQAKLLFTIVLLLITLILYVIGRLTEGVLFIPRNVILAASVLLPLFYSLSAVASHAPINSYVSGFGIQDTVAAMAILFTTLVLSSVLFAGGGKNVLIPFLAFIAGSAVVIVFQLARLIAPSFLTLGGVLAGTTSSIFGSWHDLGILAALLVFFAVVLTSRERLLSSLIRRCLIILGVLSFVLFIVVDMSDVGYALGIILILWGAYEGWLSHVRRTKTGEASYARMVLPLAVGILALLSAFGSAAIFNRLPQSLQISQVEVRPSWQSTYIVAQKVFSDGGLIFGSGPNTFSTTWGRFKPTLVNQSNFWNTDFTSGIGFIPTSFVTVGVLGLIAWLALLLAFLYRLFLFVRRSTPDRQLHGAIFGGALFLLYFHIVYAPGFAVSLILFFLLGLSIAMETADHQRAFFFSLKMRTPAAALGVVLFLAIAAGLGSASVVTAQAVSSDLLVAKAASDYNAGQPLSHAIALVQQALTVFPDNDVAHRAAVELGLLQLRALLSQGQSANTADLRAALQRTIAEGLRAVSINSSDYQNWLSLAGLYQNLANAGVAGAYENALSAYQRAAAANPTNPLPLVNAAQVALAQNDATSSLNYLNAAIVLKPDFAAAYYLRSQARALEQDFTDAITDAKTAISLAAQDPLGWYNLGTIFYVSGNYPDAITALSQAVSLNNNYSNALFVLALAYQKTGDHADAIITMQRVATLNPTNAEAQQALANLETTTTATTTAPLPVR